MKRAYLLEGFFAAIILSFLFNCASYEGELRVTLGMPEKTYISPKNQDGVQDELVVPIEIPPAYEGMAVGAYRFEISNDTGRAVRTIQVGDERSQRETEGKKQAVHIPDTLRWDGTSDSGEYVPDGEYTYVIEAWDMHGNRGASMPLVVVVDNTPPYLEVSAPYDSFSPNGDGIRDVLPIMQRESSAEELWTGRIVDPKGAAVRRLSWTGEARDFFWDGKDDSGRDLSDGRYSYAIESTDLAGNTAGFELAPLIIDTVTKDVGLEIEYRSFSPNGDGVKDTLTFFPSLGVTEHIESWEGLILDQAGNVKRVFAGTGGVPQRLEFDGTAESGEVLADGVYRGKLSVLYRNGDEPQALSPHFTIDTVPPHADVSVEYTLFSPDGDGYRDTTTITQTTTLEERWWGIILDEEGREVCRQEWTNRAGNFVWDGTDEQGNSVSDGTYTYTLTGTDSAGNSGIFTVDEIVVDTRPTPIDLSFEHPAFSPNENGVKDSNHLYPKLDLKEGVESWSLEIKDPSGITRWRMTLAGVPPESIAFDGRDEGGRVLPDGSYRGVLEVIYTKGNRPAATTPWFVIDTTPPRIALEADYLLFSPDGDGIRDGVTIRQRSSEEESWEGVILDDAGDPVRRFTWEGKAPDFDWNGEDGTGKTVADGRYTYKVSSTDPAGNSASAELRGIEVDTRETPVSIKVESEYFSPNGDGVQDEVAFTVSAQVVRGIKAWTVSIMDDTGAVRYMLSGALSVPRRITWDGKDDGRTAEEGRYSAVLKVEYEKGNAEEARTEPFFLDVTPPSVAVEVSPQRFSPDGDGSDDTVGISIAVSDASPIRSWSAVIEDRTGRPFKRFSADRTPPRRIDWDGRSDSGELVQSAEDYPLIITATDEAGNSASAYSSIEVDVLVMRENGKLKIVISSIYFKPYTADYIDIPSDRAERNLKTLDRLGEILEKFGEYRIRLEGHAVQEYWYNAQRAQEEEREELLPLSRARADAIKKALVERGIEETRMTTEGYGGTRPVVPHSDRTNHWKNRRVEFVLEKPGKE